MKRYPCPPPTIKEFEVPATVSIKTEPGTVPAAAPAIVAGAVPPPGAAVPAASAALVGANAGQASRKRKAPAERSDAADNHGDAAEVHDVQAAEEEHGDVEDEETATAAAAVPPKKKRAKREPYLWETLVPAAVPGTVVQTFDKEPIEGYTRFNTGDGGLTRNAKSFTLKAGETVYEHVSWGMQRACYGPKLWAVSVPTCYYDMAKAKVQFSRNKKTESADKTIKRLFPSMPDWDIADVLDRAFLGRGHVGNVKEIPLPLRCELAVEAHVRYQVSIVLRGISHFFFRVVSCISLLFFCLETSRNLTSPSNAAHYLLPFANFLLFFLVMVSMPTLQGRGRIGASMVTAATGMKTLMAMAMETTMTTTRT